MELFLDESGYTGPDLINVDQPVFVLASTSMSETDAAHILHQCFQGAEREAKYTKLSKSRRGREELLKFLRVMNLSDGRNSYWAAHKQFMLVTHLIDFWMEPMAFEDGLNLYKNGANIALSNISYITLGVCLGVDGRRELLRRFQVMMRDRSPFAYSSFWDAFDKAAKEHHLIREGLGVLLAAPQRLGYSHLLQLPERIMDLGDYGLLTTISHWRRQYSNEYFELVHDESRMLRENEKLWGTILDPNNPTAIVGQDRRTISFPLPVTKLRVEDSKLFPQLQVADLVSGAARELLIAIMTGSHDEYTDELRTSGLKEICSGAVWPSDQVTPEDLETTGPVLADAASFIGNLVKNKEVS